MELINIKVQRNISLSEDDVDNLLVGALEGGINYWCEKANVVSNDYKGGEFASSVISRGGSLELYEDDGSFKVLNLKKLKSGIEKYYNTQKYPSDVCNMDANDYDTIIQLAVFNEVVYG